jgi:hypothetical protein
MVKTGVFQKPEMFKVFSVAAMKNPIFFNITMKRHESSPIKSPAMLPILQKNILSR